MNYNEYDLVISGGGPAGLGLAQCCSSILGIKILLIEKEKILGGCHRVNRVKYNNEDLFTEHGPRIYSSTYKNFENLLKDMNIKFNDLFVPYYFQIINVGGETVIANLSSREMMFLIKEYIYLLFNNNYGKDVSMYKYMTKNNFSKKAITFIDRICRLSDGADINKFSLYSFLQIIDQQSMYTIYQPKYVNDNGLIKIWEDRLKHRGVDIITNSEITKYDYNYNKITSCDLVSNGKKYKVFGKQFVIATPPIQLMDILNETGIKNAFGDYDILKRWAIDTNYINYISISYHWNKKIELPKVYGFPKSDWGVAFIVLSDYMELKEKQSKTIISVAVTVTDEKSMNINKTANECQTKKEVIKEVFEQLKKVYFKNLPEPTAGIMTPNNYYDVNEKKWKSKDTAYVPTYKTGNISFKSYLYDNLYNLGTHNGYSKYNFTTLESAVTNAIKLSHILYPKLKLKYQIKRVTTLKEYILFVLLFISIIIIILYYYIAIY